MKQIFRAWDTETNRWVNPAFFAFSLNGKFYGDIGGSLVRMDEERASKVIIEMLSPFMVDQTPVWEGDILTVRFKGTGTTRNWQVWFERGMFTIGGEPLDWRYRGIADIDLIAHVGNIHENFDKLTDQRSKGASDE